MEQSLTPEALAAAHQPDQQANTRLLRGLELLEENTPASLREAVRCFDDAIELRRQLPLAANPWFRYGLIAGWMNRADALTRLGSADELSEALRSYDKAFSHLRELPMNESPLFVKRLAIAWLNRGCTLMKRGTPGDIIAAAESFREAVAAARHFFATDSSEGVALLAGVWMNLGNALIQCSPPDAVNARNAAMAALELSRTSEQCEASVAEIGFKARHILCQALAIMLERAESGSAPRDELLAEATDAVDEGMALARHWEARGASQFRAPAADLFRFGCRAYQSHQPHFLTEFLLENLDPARSINAFAGSLEMHASAMDSLWRALSELQRDGFPAINTPRFATMLEQLRELRVAEERLAVLRRVAPESAGNAGGMHRQNEI